ncbi:kelch repeat and BTB domain-containing protein 8-like [Gastrophryne carolinensis]
MEKATGLNPLQMHQDMDLFAEDPEPLECAIMKGLKELYLTHTLCDAVLVTETKRFPCHRVVLASVSPYFLAMFTSSMIETKHGEVSLLDVPTSAMQTIMHFIYTGEVALSLDNVEDLFIVSSRLQISTMVNLCSRFLTNEINSDNCFWIFSLALSHYHSELLEIALQYIGWNIRSLYKKDDFLHLEQAEVIRILSSDQLMVSSELDIYRIALHWWKVNGATDTSFPKELMSIIRFPLMLPHELDEFKRDIKKEEYDLSQPTNFKLRQGMFEKRIVCMDLQAREDPKLNDKDFFLDSYDPISDRWDKLMPLNSLMFPGCLALGNRLYVTGGIKQDDSVSQTFHVYDSVTNQWADLPSMMSPRSLQGFLSYKQRLYIVGGWDGNDVLDSTECFDLSKNCWFKLSKLHFPLCAFASAQLKGKLYIIGGETGPGRLLSEKGLLIYDISSDMWSHIPMKTVVAFGGAVTMDNKVLVIGGYDRYSPTTRELLATSRCLCLNEQGFICEDFTIPPLPKEIASAGVVRWGQRIYVFGGEKEDQFYKNVYFWTPGDSRWTECTQGLPIAHDGVSAFGCVTMQVPMRQFHNLIPLKKMACV